MPSSFLISCVIGRAGDILHGTTQRTVTLQEKWRRFFREGRWQKWNWNLPIRLIRDSNSILHFTNLERVTKSKHSDEKRPPEGYKKTRSQSIDKNCVRKKITTKLQRSWDIVNRLRGRGAGHFATLGRRFASVITAKLVSRELDGKRPLGHWYVDRRRREQYHREALVNHVQLGLPASPGWSCSASWFDSPAVLDVFTPAPEKVGQLAKLGGGGQQVTRGVWRGAKVFTTNSWNALFFFDVRFELFVGELGVQGRLRVFHTAVVDQLDDGEVEGRAEADSAPVTRRTRAQGTLSQVFRVRVRKRGHFDAGEPSTGRGRGGEDGTVDGTGPHLFSRVAVGRLYSSLAVSRDGTAPCCLKIDWKQKTLAR